MDKIESEVLAGKIELDVEFDNVVRSRVNKWAWLRDLVDDALKPVEENSPKGWAKIPLVSKAEAVRGQQSILTHIRERFPNAAWEIQTSIVPGKNGNVDLMVRKVKKVVVPAD